MAILWLAFAFVDLFLYLYFHYECVYWQSGVLCGEGLGEPVELLRLPVVGSHGPHYSGLWGPATGYTRGSGGLEVGL